MQWSQNKTKIKRVLLVVILLVEASWIHRIRAIIKISYRYHRLENWLIFVKIIKNQQSFYCLLKICFRFVIFLNKKLILNHNIPCVSSTGTSERRIFPLEWTCLHAILSIRDGIIVIFIHIFYGRALEALKIAEFLRCAFVNKDFFILGFLHKVSFSISCMLFRFIMDYHLIFVTVLNYALIKESFQYGMIISN